MTSLGHPGSADAVVVGGGTIGGWCAYFLRRAGLDRVVLLEKGLLGQGASSRAAGVVRIQGGTPARGAPGPVVPPLLPRPARRARHRLRLRRPGLPASLLHRGRGGRGPGADGHAGVAGAAGALARPGGGGRANPTLAPGQTLGGTFCADDGYITPPRNVTAYAVALAPAASGCASRSAFTGLVMEGGRVTGRGDPAGRIGAPLVVLTGGPKLAEVGALAGIRIPAGGVRHQVAVTEPHPDLRPGPGAHGVRPAGRPVLAARGGRAAVRDEQPGRAARRERLGRRGLPRPMRERLATLVPVTAGLGLRRTWAATIDYTPDHLPIIGPALGPGRAAGRGHRRQRRGARHDVGAGGRPGRRRPGAHRHLRGGGRDRRSGWTGSTRPAAAGWPRTRSRCRSRRWRRSRRFAKLTASRKDGAPFHDRHDRGHPVPGRRGGRRRPGGLGPAGRGHRGADADHGPDAVGGRRSGGRGVGVHARARPTGPWRPTRRCTSWPGG